MLLHVTLGLLPAFCSLRRRMRISGPTPALQTRSQGFWSKEPFWRASGAQRESLQTTQEDRGLRRAAVLH